MASVVNDVLAPRLIGRPAADVEALWFELVNWGERHGDQGVFTMGLSGVDLALWDLRGKRAGASICELLGGPVTDSLPAYASLPWLRSADLVLRETTRAVEAGFRAVKLHEIDPDFTALLRREFDDDLTIMVDVNGHFDRAGAIEHGRRLTELGVHWFEEPVHPMRDHAAIAEVAAAIGCDVAAGENEYTIADFERLLATGAIAHVQPEITKIGGMTPAPTVSALAERHGVALSPHNFRLGPSCAASIHWAFSSRASRWLELPFLPEDQRFSHPMPMPELRNGRVAAPTGIGLDCEAV